MGKKKPTTAQGGVATPPAAIPAAAPAAAATPPTAAPVKRIPLLEEPRITRMEKEEMEILREALYSSELDKLHRRDDERMMFPSQTNQEKLEGFKRFASMMSDPVNRRVLRVFFMVTLMMFSVPVVTLFVGMHILAPVLGLEESKETVGGLSAVAVSVGIMVWYVVFALNEDAVFDERVQAAQVASSAKATAGTGAKKHKAKGA